MRLIKIFFFSLLLVFQNTVMALGNDPVVGIHLADVYGGWDYVGFTYQGQTYTKPNDKLHVHFIFESDTILRLRWIRDEDRSSCERLSLYRIQDNILFQKVVWVNPQNSFECAKDPDMTMDIETQTPLSMPDKNQLDLHLSLNGEEFIYTLKRLDITVTP